MEAPASNVTPFRRPRAAAPPVHGAIPAQLLPVTECDVVLRLPEVVRRAGLSRSTIYRRVDAELFPAPRDLGGGAVGWLASEIAAWLAQRPRKRR